MVHDSDSWLGPYRLASRLGTGGMAEVYLARRVEPDGRVGPVVAVKRLLPHLVGDAQVVQMFLNEARITAQIAHPNVVRVLDVGRSASGEPYLAMELLEGHTFAEVRREAATAGHRGAWVPLGITLRVLTEACRGLDAAHRATDAAGRPLRVVHRDFTPENLHVDVRGHVRVLDFGIARADSLSTGTEPGTLKGKFFYMSPEMIAGRPVDHRADIFAAGVMLYEQLCGHRPFSGSNPEEVLQRIAEGRPVPPSHYNPAVPPELVLVCLTALAREPEARFASLQDFIDAIEAVGGPAEVASAEQLAAYLEALFPAARDDKRAALQRALAQVPAPGSTPPSWTRPPPSPAPREPAPHEAAPPAGAAPAAAPAAPRARRGRSPLVIALTVLAVHVAVAGWAFWPARAPAERLASAVRLKERSAREAELVALAEDARASTEQLQQAAQLLLEVDGYVGLQRVAEALQQRPATQLEGLLLEARASIALRMGRRAEAALARAEALAPRDGRPHELRADLRERQGDLAGALEALARAHAQRPKDARLAQRYGVLLSQSGRLEDADRVLGALSRGGEDGAAQAELAFVRYRQERFEEARQVLLRTLRQHPRQPLAHYYLGAVLYRLGDSAGAERAYREADRLAPRDVRHLAALCELLGRSSGREEAAQALAQELRSRFPEQAPSLRAACLER